MKPIYISRSNMPDFKKYSSMIKRLWKTRWLTNDGRDLGPMKRQPDAYTMEKLRDNKTEPIPDNIKECL